MAAVIRLASEADATALAEIYAPFCEKTAISFEYKAPDSMEMVERIRTLVKLFPWLILDDAGVVAGYAYAGRHRERAAYGWSVDTTVYVRPDYQRCGVGRALYTTLFELLRMQGYYKAFAGITLPNPASEGLHKAMGFEPVGIYSGVGYKLGAWHDVVWYQLKLQPEQPQPTAPVSVNRLGLSEWAEATRLGLENYRGGA